MMNFLLNHTPLLYLTQSLWRDEAFSVLMSEPPLKEIVKLAVGDFNPPLYYFILHFWMKIFGEGEIAIRLLSFVFHLLLVFVCYKFAKLFIPRSGSSDRSPLARSRPFLFLLFTFFNPMLIYYAFEARMYSLLALLATASMYFFQTKNWLPYIIASALGLWTQPFMVFVLLSQGAFLIFTKALKRQHLAYFLSIFLLFSPWLPVIFAQFSRSGPMWIWPINWTTVTTILGNLFTGYEGTPWDLWNKMKILSLVILCLALISRRLLFLIWLLLPTILVLIISYFKPIYVNRYLIFVAVAEVFLIADGLAKIKNRLAQALLLFSFFIFIFSFNIWFPSRHKKQDIRLTIAEIEKLAQPSDLVFSQTPLTFFETTYYFSRSEKDRLQGGQFPDRSRIFLYNPKRIEIPYYAGSNLIPKEKWVETFPEYPQKAFLIHDDATYEAISER